MFHEADGSGVAGVLSLVRRWVSRGGWGAAGAGPPLQFR